MHIEITENPAKRIELAKAITAEKSNYYTEEVLESIRTVVKDKTELTDPAEIEAEMYKTIYYYWVYGCPASEYYYLGFYNKTHDEIKEYVTSREKVIYRNRLNRLEDAHLFNNKWDTYCLFKDYFGRDVIKIETDADYPDFCAFVANHPTFVVKPTDMGGGNGVHKVTTDPAMTDEDRRKLFREILAENEKNKKLYHRGKENSMILEELLVQVPEMAVIHPNSVNGVRVTAVHVGDKVHIMYPWFKIGRFGQFLTSAIFGTLDAVIDAETGVVITPGCSEFNERFDVHPDTGVPILGFRIPKWKELIDTVTELAMKVDTVRYVGWDMVLTEKGWVLMEGNFSGDFCWQFCLNRGTKKEFEDMIGWKLTKDFWWQE
ncbi:MAG: hypothetical protein J5950_02010 [Clostridia bacterium]|nr:hypothetical protein [Clostridia bacterium]